MGKILIIFCPKLDSDIDGYITKLAEILVLHTINSITVVHMEVPCCSGVRYVVDQALEQSGKKVPVKDYTITISGEIEVTKDFPVCFLLNDGDTSPGLSKMHIHHFIKESPIFPDGFFMNRFPDKTTFFQNTHRCRII